ncbi:metallophosphoesterase [Haloferacaceae archaeon DSL9]
MQLGVVSDTHDSLDLVDAAVSFFESRSVDAVIHCGDIVAPFAATPFDAGAFDFYAVRGNNDGEWNLQNAVSDFGTYLGEAGELDFEGTTLAVYHGTSDILVNGLVESGRYDFVLHGHTHEHAVEAGGNTVRVNPGGLPIPPADDAFHVALLDTTKAGAAAVEHHELG